MGYTHQPLWPKSHIDPKAGIVTERLTTACPILSGYFLASWVKVGAEAREILGSQIVKRELLQQLSQTLKSELRKSKRRTSTSIVVIIGLTIAIFVIDYSLREPDAPVPNPGTDLSCEVRNIYDGDTLTVGCDQGRLKVRVWGIDAPEKGQKPWGDDSRDFLSQMVGGKTIQVQVVDKDRYGRVVARLFLGEQDIGLSMINKGKAAVYTQYNDSRTYREAQVVAQNQKVGIWSQPGAQQDPSSWRKTHARK